MNSITSNIKSSNKSKSNNTLLQENRSFNELDNYENQLNFQRSNLSSMHQEIIGNNKYSDNPEDQKNYVNDLLRKLQLAKEERKVAEKNSKILEHRVVLLMNQEKSVLIH